MDVFKSFKQKALKFQNDQFASFALELFKYQSKSNPIYAKYINLLGIDPEEVHFIEQIPFLPIQFFKDHKVISEKWDVETYFESSGTTGMQRSIHYVRDLEFYLNHCENTFVDFYGPLKDFRILALLPSYLERKHSSLVAMVKSFIDKAAPGSGFYLDNMGQLVDDLQVKEGHKKMLWGVSFAILELAEKFPMDLSHVLLMETGGMKGRREELTREELYEIFRSNLNVTDIHAEYGMTELLSQSYGKNGQFRVPDTMRILLRDMNDPFQYIPFGRTGGINIIDLANIHSCSFIETKDLGRAKSDGTFEVLGRFDNSDLRGCNLMF